MDSSLGALPTRTAFRPSDDHRQSPFKDNDFTQPKLQSSLRLGSQQHPIDLDGVLTPEIAPASSSVQQLHGNNASSRGTKDNFVDLHDLELTPSRIPETSNLAVSDVHVPKAVKPLLAQHQSHIDQTKLVRLMSAMGRPKAGAAFTSEEEEFLVFLKEETPLTWTEIHRFFPHRSTWHTLQGRYSHKLNKNRQPRDKDKPVKKSSSPALPSVVLPDGARRSTRTHGSFNYYIPDPFAESIEPSHTESEDVLPEISREPSRDAHVANTSDNDLHIMASQGRPWVSPAVAALERARDHAAIAGMEQRILRPPQPVSPNMSGKMHGMKKMASISVHKPYLCKAEREFLGRRSQTLWKSSEVHAWDGQILHVDFTRQEIACLKESVRAVISKPVQEASKDEMRDIATRAIQKGRFINRTLASIVNFISDMAYGEANKRRSVMRLAVRRQDCSPMDQLLRHRELGNGSRPTSRRLMARRIETTMGPARLHKGMSSDVNTIAWSTDSDHFAIGSAAVTDIHSMQYNRPVNLVFGSARRSHLKDLPQHMVPRLAQSGVNATASMQNTQDPYLFTTISSLEFASDGGVLISGGYDKAVRLWVISRESGTAFCRYQVPCNGPVDVVAPGPNGLFAVATQTLDRSIKLYKYEREGDFITECKKRVRLWSAIASERPELQIHPTSLRWAGNGQSSRHLLGGFASKDDAERRGETCLWDIETGRSVGVSINKRAVFDIAWSPSVFGRFAIGCTASGTVNRGTKSVVRIHDTRSLPADLQGSMTPNGHPTLELECPALDMNDIVLNATHEELVCAGCTDGRVYVWDLRRPDKTLHILSHGEPLMELDASLPREQADTGVRFASWNIDGRRLYSGSSDGVVSVWNPYLAEEDAYQYDVVRMDSGIMAGKFSPDGSHILVGDVQGSALLVSVSQEDRDMANVEPFEFTAATRLELADSMKRLRIPAAPTVDDPSTGLIRSGQIEVRSFGDFPRRQAVQGPNYVGPFDSAADAEVLRQQASWFQSHAMDTLRNGTDDSKNLSVCALDAEVTDNGSWKHRIPEAFRAEEERANEGGMRSHLADFGCFRCANAGVFFTGGESSELQCDNCGGRWQPDVLGYRLVRDGAKWPVRPGVEDRGEPLVDTLDELHDLWEVDRSTMQPSFER